MFNVFLLRDFKIICWWLVTFSGNWTDNLLWSFNTDDDDEAQHQSEYKILIKNKVFSFVLFLFFALDFVFWQLWDTLDSTGFNYVSHKAPLLLVSMTSHSTAHTMLKRQTMTAAPHHVLVLSAPRRDLLSELGTVSSVFSFIHGLNAQKTNVDMFRNPIISQCLQTYQFLFIHIDKLIITL